MNDPFDLQRFVAAQARVYADVCAELAAGAKRTHWMWFVFPQIAGLGQSAMAQRYAIGSLAEAAAYLTHPLLGPRLQECTGLVNAVQGRSVHTVFGSPDDMKFHSSMTLFANAAAGGGIFRIALDQWFAGRADAGTVRLLQQAGLTNR